MLTLWPQEEQFETACQKFMTAMQIVGYKPTLSYNIALCHYMMKQYAPALKHIADIIERGIREHPGTSHWYNLIDCRYLEIWSIWSWCQRVDICVFINLFQTLPTELAPPNSPHPTRPGEDRWEKIGARRSVGKFDWKIRWESSVGKDRWEKFSGKVWWESLVGKFGGKVWWESLVGKFGGKVWWESLVGKFGGKVRWEKIGRKS